MWEYGSGVAQWSPHRAWNRPHRGGCRRRLCVLSAFALPAVRSTDGARDERPHGQAFHRHQPSRALRGAVPPIDPRAPRADLDALIESRVDRQRFQEHHWEGTFFEYLDLVQQRPAIIRNAFQRVYNAVLAHGFER